MFSPRSVLQCMQAPAFPASHKGCLTPSVASTSCCHSNYLAVCCCWLVRFFRIAAVLLAHTAPISPVASTVTLSPLLNQPASASAPQVRCWGCTLTHKFGLNLLQAYPNPGNFCPGGKEALIITYDIITYHHLSSPHLVPKDGCVRMAGCVGACGLLLVGWVGEVPVVCCQHRLGWRHCS